MRKEEEGKKVKRKNVVKVRTGAEEEDRLSGLDLSWMDSS